MSQEPRQIAVVTDYDGLVAACRARADALNISRDTIDEVAGLPKGYASKALMAMPFDGKSASGGRLSARNLGRITLGPMLGALGIALVVVEDPEALARVSRRMGVRNKAQVRALLPVGSRHRNIKLITRRSARKMNDLRTVKVPRWRRIAIAKKAARAKHRKARLRRRASRNAPVTTCG